MFISAIPLSSLISTHGPVLFKIQTIIFQLHTCKVLRVDFFFIVLKIISTDTFSHCLRCPQIHILLWLCKLRLTHSQGENNTSLFATTGNKLNCFRDPLTPVQVYVPSKQKVRCECCGHDDRMEHLCLLYSVCHHKHTARSITKKPRAPPHFLSPTTDAIYSPTVNQWRQVGLI